MNEIEHLSLQRVHIKQGRKRPLDTLKRILERREREGEGERDKRKRGERDREIERRAE